MADRMGEERMGKKSIFSNWKSDDDDSLRLSKVVA